MGDWQSVPLSSILVQIYFGYETQRIQYIQVSKEPHQPSQIIDSKRRLKKYIIQRQILSHLNNNSWPHFEMQRLVVRRREHKMKQSDY